MNEQEWFKMLSNLFGQEPTENLVVFKKWELSGQLVIKHYQRNENIYVIYPN